MMQTVAVGAHTHMCSVQNKGMGTGIDLAVGM